MNQQIYIEQKVEFLPNGKTNKMNVIKDVRKVSISKDDADINNAHAEATGLYYELDKEDNLKAEPKAEPKEKK